ncbi:MAG: NAD(P)-dependent oxidoreductase [Actinomycetaceae bacterium]|nr:NAD(P)-dependent oxidoreductase [Actinomycetaceae bacterium]
MKVLISDYKDSMMPEHNYEIEVLKAGLPNVDVEVYEYTDANRLSFIEKIGSVDALLTAFIPIDKAILDNAPVLKVISLNATGYDNVDLTEATKHSIGVCPVGEYCTQDVAEHTIALMLSLNKNLKYYAYSIERSFKWAFDAAPAPVRIGNQTLGIFGLGRIGRAVASKAQCLGMKVIAHDPFVNAAEAQALGVELTDLKDLLRRSDVISNHMNLGEETTHYFTDAEFKAMARRPIFLNLGRGLSVDEAALVEALDTGQVRAAGLDVLTNERPVLEGHPLTNRPNVIITPHSAFYSEESFIDIQRISCQNIVNYLTNKKDKVFKLVNDV